MEKDILQTLLAASPHEGHAEIVKAWMENVKADPKSMPAQWAIVHYSLANLMSKNSSDIDALKNQLKSESSDILKKIESIRNSVGSDVNIVKKHTEATLKETDRIVQEYTKANEEAKNYPKQIEETITRLNNACKQFEQAVIESGRIPLSEKIIYGSMGLAAGLMLLGLGLMF